MCENMKKKNRMRKICILLVMGLLVDILSLYPSKVGQAEENYGLMNPTIDAEGVSTWDTVYFGSYCQSRYYPSQEPSSPVDGEVYTDLDGTKFTYKFTEMYDGPGDGIPGRCTGFYKYEPIRWRVLTVNGNDAFLLSDKNLDTKPFHDDVEMERGCLWENCSLRTWLNGEFFELAFDEEEALAVKETTVVNEANPNYGTYGGKNTQDKVYCLSMREAMTRGYGFAYSTTGTNRRIVENTQYAEAAYDEQDTALLDISEVACKWWVLRTPGRMGDDDGINNVEYDDMASIVDEDGVIIDDIFSRNDPYPGYGIRPAIHLDLSSNCWTYGGKVYSAKEEKTPTPDSTKTPTPVAVVTKKPNVDSSFKLGNNVSFEVPEDVPFIGGGEIGLDFDSVPVQFEKKGNTYRLGIGCQDVNDTEWTSFKKFVETQKEDYRKGCNGMLAAQYGEASMGWKVKPKISCYGYAEGTIENGKIQSVAGKAVIGMKVSVSKEWQNIVVVVPVVLKLKGKVGVQTTYAVGFDFSQKEVYLDGDIELTLPEITISAGIGVMYIADVSAYGTADNKIKISKSGRVTGSLTGEVGVSAKVLFASYKKKLLDGTWDYYDSDRKKTKSQNLLEMGDITEASFSIPREKSVENSGLEGVNSLTGEEADRETESVVSILTENGYQDMKPEMVTVKSGKVLLVYTANRSERTTGNHTAVCYRLYDPETSEWTEEKMIEDDGTADFYPEIASDGTKTYVVWNDTCHTDFTAETSLEEVSKSCEIKVAEFDADKECFGAVEKLTDNAFYDMKPDVTLLDGVPYVCWTGYEGDDFLTMQGTKRVMMASMEGEDWKISELCSTDKLLRKVEVGVFDDVGIVYSQDEDGSLNTTEDSELYFVKPGKAPEKLTENDVFEENPCITTIAGNNAFVWFVDGEGIYQKMEDGNISCLVDDDGVLSSDYEIIRNGTSDMLLCSSQKESGSNLYGYMLQDGRSSKAFRITDMNGYAGNVTGCSANTGYGISFVNSKAEITEMDVKESFDLCFIKMAPYSNLRLESVDYLEENVIPGQELQTIVKLSNQGTKEVNDATIVIQIDGKEILSKKIERQIDIGETEEIQVQVPLPDDLKKETNLRLFIIADEEELDNMDNEYSVKIGKTELELECSESHTNGKSKILTVIKNTSGFDTKAVLRILSNDANGNVLKEYKIGPVAAGAFISKEITEEEIAAIAKNGDSLYVEVSADSEEQFYSNNFSFVSVTESIVQPENMDSGNVLTDNGAVPPQFATNVIPGENPQLSTPDKKAVIKVPKAKIKSVVKRKDRKIKIRLKKLNNISGYQLQYGTNKKFRKSKKRFVKKDIFFTGKLKKKTYFIRARAYTLSGKKKVYGKWSEVVKVKT